MRSTVYAIEDQVEDSHWWFVCRRHLFSWTLKKSQIKAKDPVLDIGIGAGGNLRMLRDLGIKSVTAVDKSEDALNYCKKKGFDNLYHGDVNMLPFSDSSFKFILATDILEHVEDDLSALVEISRVLKKGGEVLITVPAFLCLWGLQDEVAEHKRRYLLNEIIGKIDKSGLKVTESYYFNYLLFAPILVSRFLIKVFKIKLSSENELNSPLINLILKGIFFIDIYTAKFVKPPFGVSIFIVAKKV